MCSLGITRVRANCRWMTDWCMDKRTEGQMHACMLWLTDGWTCVVYALQGLELTADDWLTDWLDTENKG